MRRSPDLLNRFVLTLIGIGSVALGLYVIGRSAGWFNSDNRRGPLLSAHMEDTVSRNAAWFWPVLLAGCLIIAIGALWWLRQQFRLPLPAATDLVLHSDSGVTRISAGGAQSAVEADAVERIDRVESAHARLVGDQHDAELDLRLDIEPTGDITTVTDQVETDILPRLRQALQLDELITNLHLRLAAPARKVR